MFGGIIQNMDPLQVSDQELGRPFTLNTEGKVASLGDWMDQEAPQSVRVAFHRGHGRKIPRVRSVADLDDEGLRQLTVAVLKAADPRKKVAIVGRGDYSPGELVREVERDTELVPMRAPDFEF
jgi:hypothetical protein